MNENRNEADGQRDLNPENWLDQHGDFLFNYALTRLRDREAAEEVVQDTFVAGIKGLEQYSGRGVERAWLLGILKRKIVDLIRKRVRARTSGIPDSQDDITEMLFDQSGKWKSDPRIFGESPEANLNTQDFWRELTDCIDGLPDKQADVFTLRELEEKTSEEICKELGLTTTNLWVLLHRARLRLANCLKLKWGVVN